MFVVLVVEGGSYELGNQDGHAAHCAFCVDEGAEHHTISNGEWTFDGVVDVGAAHVALKAIVHLHAKNGFVVESLDSFSPIQNEPV